MIRVLSSTRRQIAFILGASLVLSHALVILTVVTVFDDRDQHLPPHVGLAMQIIGRLYAASPSAGARAEVLENAAQSGMPMDLASRRQTVDCNVPPTPIEGFGAPVLCPRTDDAPGALVPAGAAWLSLPKAQLMKTLPPHPHHPWVLFYSLTMGIGLPTLILSLWASRRVTAPLQALARAAEHVGTDDAAVALPVQGTAEIRLLAGSFNRLIIRLQAFAAEQRRIVAAVSHDLRTPLTRLRLRLEAVPDPALRDKLVRDVDTLQMIADSSLSLARAQETRFRTCPVDIGALLQTVVDESADTGADVSMEGLLHLTAPCEPAMLTRAMENLVENAVKYAGHALVRLGQDQDAAIIEVLDHGPGIAPEDKPHVFEPYRRGDAARTGVQGNGLGLSIARSVIDAHGGTLALHDVAPTGLLVRVVLPL